MKVTAEKIDKHQVTLAIEVPGEEVAKAFQKAYQRLASKVNIPGFRKGKAPRKILEMRIGTDALKEEAFELLATPAYQQALEQEDLEPVSRPDVKVEDLEDGQPFSFKITVTVKPEVTLGEYKGLSVEKPAAQVTDAEVEESLNTLRDRQAQMVLVEDGVIEKGDFAVIDFAGTVDGVPFSGGEGKGYPLEVGSGSFIPGFEEQLIGVKTGEDKVVKVSFPEDYHVKELAGKAAEFTVNVHEVKRKQLPELSDEFAKSAGSFETLDALKADMKAKMLSAAETRAKNEYERLVVKAAVDNATVDLPDIMVDDRTARIVEDFAYNLESRGMKLDQYLEYTKKTLSELKASYKDIAVEQVKADLVMEAIAKAEKLEVTDLDIKAELISLADQYNTPFEDVRRTLIEQGNVDVLKDNLLRRKASKVVLNSVKE